MKVTFRFIGNLLFILTLNIVLFSYAMFQGGFVSWFLFYSFLPILLYLLVLVCYPIKNWQVTRVLSGRLIKAGGTAQVVLTIERKFPFPLYYGIFEEIMSDSLNRKDRKHHNYSHLNEPEKLLFTRSMKKIFLIGFRKRIEIPFKLEELPRGEHKLEAVRVRISDVFGFVKKEHVFTLEDELLVQPHEREIKLSDGAQSFEQGQTAVNSLQLENTTVATGVREYEPGDRFSWIHWKQTAKNQMVMTKEFEIERSNQLLLILDATLPKNINPPAFEASVELALSMLAKLENTTSDVHLLTIGSEVRSFSIRESNQLKGDIRYYLTKIQPDGEESFSRLLKETMQGQKRLERLVIFTSSIDDFFRLIIQELKQRTAQIVVMFIQGSAFILESEQKMIAQMKKEGTKIHVLTERQLAATPLEVSIR